MKKYSKLMAVLLVVAMLLPGIAQAAPVAQAEGVEVTRLGGVDRVGTSVLASQAAYDKADAVVLAGFGGDVDALTGTLLAAAKKAPLLITRKAELTKEAADEIARLEAKTVYILGGETVVSAAVQTELEKKYTVKRIAGDNREETAIAVAKEVKGTEATHVFLTLGRMPVPTDALADALAIGPVSAMKNMPVLLTGTKAIPASTAKAMKDMGVTHVTIIGGPAAVSADVATELAKDYTVNRVAGDSRENTALEIAAEYFATPKNYIVAYGRSSADALVGGYLGAKKNAPILLTNNAGLTEATKAKLAANPLDTYILGGTTVVTKTVEDQVVEALGGEVEEPVEELKVESVSAINAKTLEVKFNKEVAAADQAKATFEVKRGTVNVSLTATWAADGKSVELASVSNLIAGDYTVTVKGLTEEALVSEVVKVEAPKATALEVKSTVLNDDTTKAKVNLALTDQYGEEMTLVSSNFTRTAYNVTQGKSVTLNFDGTGKYFFVNTKSSADAFKPGDVVRVTFLENKTGLQASANLEVVLGAIVDTITFGEVELPKNETLLTSNLKDVKVPYVAKDQFGNAIDLVKDGNVTIVSSDQDVLKAANVTLVKEDKVTKAKISSFEKEGKVTLTILSKESGNTARIVLDVQQAPGQIANLTILDPAVTIAKNSTGYVGLQMTDMYGKEIKAKDYIGKFNIVSSNPAVVANNDDLKIENTAGDNYGKVAVKVLTGATKGATTTITMTDKATGKVTGTFVVTAGETAVPTVIEIKETSKHKTTLANGAKTTIGFTSKDQYGNAIANDGAYKVEFSVKDASENITLTSAVAGKVTANDETAASVEVNAAKVGSSVLVANLVKTVSGVDTIVDSKQTTFTVVANESTAGIKVSDIPTLYKGETAGYTEDVNVETADGIALPASSIISVSSNKAAVKVTGSTAEGWKVKGVDGSLETKDGNKVDTTATITVIYNADDKPVTLTKDVTVSAADLKAANILTLDKKQDDGTGLVQELADNTKEVTTVNVADFDTLKTKADLFAVVQDNFGRYKNAVTGGANYNDVTLQITNKVGFNAGVTPDTLTLNANGHIVFTSLGDNVIEAGKDSASFRILITKGGVVQAVNVNVGAKGAAQKAVETAIATDTNALATPTIQSAGANLGTLASSGSNGTSIAWASGNTAIVNDAGAFVANGTTTLTATISKAGGNNQTVVFDITAAGGVITKVAKR